MTQNTTDVADNLAHVTANINAAAQEAQRDPAHITLVAVSKVHTEERILPALTAGHRVFGENRIQETQSKWPALRARFPDVRLHLIGPLQSNKAKEAVALFDAIETVDRPKIAQTLAKEMAAQNKYPDLFIQINTGEEAQKSGIAPADAADFIAHCRHDLNLRIHGLMCIPPVDEEAALHFALLRKIAAAADIAHLSMGMSGDYETAILFGATHVRIGTDIFGTRPTHP
jgi:pyridoxal phosphate enzyme (YggS family)